MISFVVEGGRKFSGVTVVMLLIAAFLLVMGCDAPVDLPDDDSTQTEQPGNSGGSDQTGDPGTEEPEVTPTAELSYQLTDAQGNIVEGTDFMIDPNSVFELVISQSSSYGDKDGSVTATPVAWTRITTPDTLKVDTIEDLSGFVDKLVVETCSDELDGAQPYYRLGEVTLAGEVTVQEFSASEDGKTLLYKATAVFSQAAEPVNIEGKPTIEFTYTASFLLQIEVTLLSVEYDQEVIWEDAHDNIYTNSQIVITRRAKYSDGTVNETKFYSTKNFIQSVTSYDKKNTSGEIMYHNYGATDIDDRTIATCATGVPDFEHFVYDPANIELPAYKGPVGVWSEYKHQYIDEFYNEAVQTEGFYGKQFGYRYLVISEYINGSKYHAIRNYKIDLIYKDRFFCIDGKLFTCEPLEHTHRWSVETIETPNRGTCALHKLEADVTWLGRDFYYAVVDTVYVNPAASVARMASSGRSKVPSQYQSPAMNVSVETVPGSAPYTEHTRIRPDGTSTTIRREGIVPDISFDGFDWRR